MRLAISSKRSFRSTMTVATVLVGSLLLVSVSPAVATSHKPTPTARQVHAAVTHARAVAASVAKAHATVVAAQARLTALSTDLEVLVEKWDGAEAAVAEAQNQLRADQAAQAAAMGQAQFAQGDVDRLATSTYQLGPELAGGLGQWVAVVDSIARSGGIWNLTDRTADIGYVAQATTRTMTNARRLRAQAQAATAQTMLSLADVQAKQAQAAAALATVRTREAAQKAELGRLSNTLAGAQQELSAAQKSAAQLAAHRSVALAAAAAARARAEAQRRAQRTHSTSHSGGSSGTGNGGTGGRSSDGGSANNGDRHDPRSYVGRYPQGVSHTTAAQRLGALAYARAHIGDPYIAGHDGPHAFDCSGLTSAAYRSVGWSMIHFSQSQFLAGEKIPLAHLQPGDLVFYATDPADWHTIHHVVFYAGNSMMIEAPHTGAFVREWSIYPDGLVPYGARP